MAMPLLSTGIRDLTGGDPAAETHVPANQASAPLLLQYWHIVLRWKYVIGAILLGSLIIGVVATLMATPQYTAETQIEITRDQKNPTNVEGLESDKSSQDLEFYQTQYELLGSRSLAERVARQLNLGNSDEFFRAHSLQPPRTEADAQARMRSAASLLLAHARIEPIQRSRLVNVFYTCGSPELSAKIANAWTANFIQASMDRRFMSTKDARVYLEARLAELATKLEESERKSASFAADHNIVALGGGGGKSDGTGASQQTLAANELQSMSNELTKATADRMAAQSTISNGQNSAAVQNGTISTLRQRRAELAAEYAQMMVQFEPGYPAARTLQQRIASLDSAIASEENRINRAHGSDYAQALAREHTLQTQVEHLKATVQQQTRDSIQYNIYRRDADTNLQLYNSLLQRYKEIGVAGVAANNIAVVDAAEVPNSKSSPSLIKNLLVALIAGLILTALVVVGLEQIDEGLREPGDVRRLLHLPLLGTIPVQAEGEPLVLLADPKSELSEAYLSVRSNLAFTTDHGVPKTFMVTSASPGEGKSTTALSLATVLSRTNNRTLLIDGDMRSPSVHGFMEIDNKEGLSNLLAGDNDWERLIHAPRNRMLSFLPAGPMPPSAAELLSSDRLSLLLQQLGEHYDNIVIDAPPLLGLADSPLLSRAVEGCVFVVESGGVAVRGLRSALSRLQQAHAHIFGVVLTKVTAHHSGYGYGYGYGYGNDATES